MDIKKIFKIDSFLEGQEKNNHVEKMESILDDCVSNPEECVDKKKIEHKYIRGFLYRRKKNRKQFSFK